MAGLLIHQLLIRGDLHRCLVVCPGIKKPHFDLAEVLPQYLEGSKTAGRNSVIKAFRNWVKEQIHSQY